MGLAAFFPSLLHLYPRIELPEQIDSMEVYQRAIQEHIAIAPGPIFSAKGEFRNCVRLNCGNPWTAKIEQAMKRLGEIIAGLRRCSPRA